MCFHWQDSTIDKFQSSLSGKSEESINIELDRIRHERSEIEKSAQKFCEENGYELSDILRHGFYSGQFMYLNWQESVCNERLETYREKK